MMLRRYIGGVHAHCHLRHRRVEGHFGGRLAQAGEEVVCIYRSLLSLQLRTRGAVKFAG
jgi:hypothetical protein